MEVACRPQYTAWAQSFGKGTKHIMLADQGCPQNPPFRAGALLHAKLRFAAPGLLPPLHPKSCFAEATIPSFEKLKMRGEIESYTRKEKASWKQTNEEGVALSSLVSAAFPPNVDIGILLYRFNLLPLRLLGRVDRSQCLKVRLNPRNFRSTHRTHFLSGNH